MAEYCTIYCKLKNFSEASELMHSHFPQSVADPHCGEWDSLAAHGDQGSIRLTAKAFRERGDEFCRLLLSTCNFVEQNTSGDVATKNRVVSHVESCELAIGVVVEPTFASDERNSEIVFTIAKALEGIIFNGQAMLDAHGETLIGAQ